jgi:hypothetical protein
MLRYGAHRMGNSNYYFATVDPQTNMSTGTLVTSDGQMFSTASGGVGRGYLPEGKYEFREVLDIRKDQTAMRPQSSTTHKGFKKFQIAGVGPTSAGNGGLDIVDSRYPGKPRTGVMAHYDGPSKTAVPRDGDGSEGCLAYRDLSAQAALQSAIARGDTGIEVVHRDKAEADRLAREMSERLKKAQPERSSSASPAANGEPSKTTQAATVIDGERSVVLGQKQLVAAQMTSPHSKGGVVTDGSPSVFLGKQQLPFARVEDPTSDGGQVATGEESVRVA